jgi:acyl-CoA thioesterase FadM
MHDDKIESLRLVTRGYEISSSGHVSASQYLKYLEHIRWSMISGSEKLPFRRFWLLAVVRSQVLEIRRQVSFDVELELTMWMSRLGKTSVDLSHDIVRVSDGSLVARSTATIVSLDANRRPSPIDAAAREYLVERETVAPERFEGAPPEDAWERPVDVRPSDHDLQQHVNHARYADFVEDTRWFCASAGGYGPGEWETPPWKVAISYEQEARVGDGLIARTWHTEGRAGSLDFALMKPSGVATRARVVLATARPARSGS